jgi:hypothetical protein
MKEYVLSSLDTFVQNEIVNGIFSAVPLDESRKDNCYVRAEVRITFITVLMLPERKRVSRNM